MSMGTELSPSCDMTSGVTEHALVMPALQRWGQEELWDSLASQATLPGDFWASVDMDSISEHGPKVILWPPHSYVHRYQGKHTCSCITQNNI